MLSRLKENRILIFIRLIPSMLTEYSKVSKHLARSGMSSSKEKFRTEITMDYHAIEKGLSLPQPRPGFGEDRVLKLLKSIRYYLANFNDSEYLEASLATVDSYLKFQSAQGYQSEKQAQITREYSNICTSYRIDLGLLSSGGTKQCSKDEIKKFSQIDFEGFANSRYSIRKFADKPVDDDLLRRAIQVARKSPSACNRQAYRIHVYSGDKKNELLKMQGGSNGFIDSIDKVVLISGDYQKYFLTEMHMPYVDGSLFAMSFMYALHSLGVGSIPLTMARSYRVLNKVKERFGISASEVPVMLIGIGHLLDEFEVAYSYRHPLETFTTFH